MQLLRHSVKKQTAFTNTVPRNDVHVCHAEHNRQPGRGIDAKRHRCIAFFLLPAGEGKDEGAEEILKRVQDDKKYNSKQLTVSSEWFNYNKKTANCSQFNSHCKCAAFTLAEGVKDAFHLRQRKCAFTLAEVLITLTIIGVIAAMTMPTLIAKYQEKATVVKLKRTYNVLNNALQMAKIEDADISSWFSETNSRAQNHEALYTHLKPYLKIGKECGTESGCLPKGYLKSLTGQDYMDYDNSPNEYRVLLNDGTALMFYYTNRPPENLNSEIGNIKVYTGGKKGPNMLGRDVFAFTIDAKGGIYPYGSPDKEFPFAEYCNISDTTSNTNGWGCAAWVILNENMDYLYCDDLSWTGKTKCE